MKTSRRMLSILWRYALAVLSVGAALAITLLFRDKLGATPGVLFFVAVVISSWSGGLGPGLVAVLLSMFAIDYFFIDSRNSPISLSDVSRLIVFGLAAFIISWLGAGRKRAEESLRRALDEMEAKVEQRTADLLKANELLKQSRERYYELFENANDVVYTLDIEGNLTSLNKAGELLTGYSRDELLGKSIVHLVAPEDVERMRGMMARKMAGESITTYELEIVANDGRRLTLEVSSRLIYERDQAIGIQGIARDITERKLVEEALRQSEERFSKAFNASPHLVTISTLAEGRYLDVNEAVLRATGYTREEIVGRTAADLNIYVDHEDRTRLLDAFKDQRRVREMEVRFRAKDGRALTVLLSAEIITLDGEKCLLTASNDITERKRTEEALRQSEERFAKAFQASPLALTITSLKTGRLLEVNETFIQVSGYSREEAVGRTTLELGLWVKPADREAELAMVSDSGQVRNVEYHFRMKNGAELVGLLSAERLEIGGEPCALTVIEDITERKQIEHEREQLLARERAARREAEAANRMKDEFLATVSHELRTPLNAILGWADMLRGGKLEPELAKRGLETIARNARSQAQLIEDLLDVSRIITGKLRLDVHPVGLIPIISAAVDAVRPAAFAKEIDLRVTLDPTVGSVTGDPTRLQQIVWNLLANAIKFTPIGGSVEIRLEQAGRDASIVVCDTGAGINREFLPHVFDRFRQADSSYTRRHGGLGLGLAIVRHLVEMHGGTVEARSDGEGCGATFIVNLPMTQNRIADFGFAVNKAGEEKGSSLITHHSSLLVGLGVLVVDDEPDARELIKLTLEQHGARVITAASVAEAITALNQCVGGDRLDVILSDIGMPGEDGLSLIGKMRAVESIEKIPAIALTAYARDEDRERALTAGYEMHIAKPFNPSDLAEAVSSVARKEQA